ncbi:unnamed protein product [Clonostachys rosea f. rosea IK726]|uniref:Uncharacterized protein n=2 Tax=Bionectria ochroleuca TaxID=29856 RepID=A0A0B7KAF8_BIOOC|nr:unnamed protein product [Clonostachys rosea f. rosea IK726]
MSRQLPPGTIIFGPDATCTLDTCPVDWSIYSYRPSLPGNATLLALFGVVGIIHTYLGIRWKSWGFMVGMQLGCISEIIGYIGRIMLYNNPWSFIGFMIQIVCLTIAPVFFTASIYVTLSKTIVHLAPELSRFKPQLFYWIFIPADVVCLALQAAGGAMSTNSDGGDNTGVNISMAGLALQVVVLVLFIAAFSDYMIRYWRSGRMSGFPWRLKAFFAGLTVSILLILARCCYRVAELREGYSGDIIKHEIPFIVLEGAFIVVAAFALCWGHPGLALRDSHKESGKASDSEQGTIEM